LKGAVADVPKPERSAHPRGAAFSWWGTSNGISGKEKKKKTSMIALHKKASSTYSYH
jgi:hypothetical protein